MAKPIPNFTALGETPDPRPISGVARIDTSGMDATLGVSRARISAGGALMAGAADLAVAQDHWDSLRAEDALNKLKNEAVNLSVGEDGFQTKRGADAVTQPLLKDYGARFTQVQTNISAGLQNDRQRAKFGQRAQVPEVQFKQDILKHTYAESLVYGKQVIEGTVKTEVRNAQVNYDDPFAVAASRDRIGMSIDNAGKQFGWTKEEVAAVRQDALTQLTTGVIVSAIANGNIDYATEYYKAYRNDLDLQTQTVLLKEIRNGEQRTLMNGYQSQFLAARDNPKLLGILEKNVSVDKVLDEDRKNTLLGRILGRQEILEAKRLRVEASSLATLQAGISEADTMILNGRQPDLGPLVDAAKGTIYEPTVRRQIEFSNQVAAFMAAPPIEQEKAINQLAAQVAANPTPEGDRTLARLKAINNAQDEAIKKDPYSYGRQNNLGAPPPLDFTDPLTIGDQIAVRIPFARGMKENYRAPMKPVSEGEAQLIADGLKGLLPPAKAAALHSMTAKIGDGEAIRELAGQIAPKDKELATGMLLAARDMKAGNGRTVAELYFKGQQAMKDKTAKIDDKAEFGVRAEIAKALDGVYATPEGMHTALEATLHVYAGLKVDGTDNIERAMQLVTGGVVKHNGGKIALPYSYGGKGWFDSRFADAIAKVTTEDLIRMGGGEEFRVGRTTLSAEDLRKQLPGARLQTVGDGQYAIQSDAGYVRRSDGRALILDMTAPRAPVSVPLSQESDPDQILTSRDKSVDRARKQKTPYVR